jgi:hypothetical protein
VYIAARAATARSREHTVHIEPPATNWDLWHAPPIVLMRCNYMSFLNDVIARK